MKLLICAKIRESIYVIKTYDLNNFIKNSSKHHVHYIIHLKNQFRSHWAYYTVKNQNWAILTVMPQKMITE